MASAYARSGLGPHQVLAYVPVGPETARSRGYDQTEGLARGLARQLDLVWAPGLLSKSAGVLRQSELDRRQRFDNVRGAFQARLPKPWVGCHILLVDDILTTGATAQACSQALLAAGAGRVDLLVLARSC
jgi:predicted amidophosphoribosyltransferase